MAITWLNTAACATSTLARYEPVPGTSRQLGGIVEDIETGPLNGVSCPGPGAPILRVRLYETVRQRTRYDAQVRAVYERQEQGYLGAAVMGGATLLALGADTTDNNVGVLALGALAVWGVLKVDRHTRTEYRVLTRREHFPELDTDSVVQRPVAGESLITPYGRTTTDAQGNASLRLPIGAYDAGIRITHERTGNSYIVRRVERQREITADWLGPLLAVGSAATAGTIANRIRQARRAARLGTASAGPEALVVWIVVDLVLDRVVSHVLREIGTSTEQYYDCIIVRER